MAETHFPPEPGRPTDTARLGLAKLPAEAHLPDVFARACELAAEAVGVERVGVWLYVENKTALRCANLFERSRHEHSAGVILRVADFPTYFAMLSLRKSIPAEVAAADPRTKELAAAYLGPLGITSMLDAGIFVAGELVGVVCYEHTGPPREWTTEVRDFAGSIADQVAVRIQTAKVADLRAALRTQSSRLAMVEKVESLQQIAAGLTHDFRNVLSVVLGTGELLLGRTDLAPGAREQVENMTHAARRGVGLANDLLEFSRPTAHAPAVVNLADVTADFLSVLRAAAGHRHPIRFARPRAVGQVLVDRGEFTRVALNLVVNARDATPDGGPIAIRVAPVCVHSRAGPAGHYVMLEVADQGVGMDEATRQRACDPFFTTKPNGTGIGLAVVRRAVDQAGGFLRIESELGRGTAVRALFPRVGASSGGTTEYPALPPNEE